MLIWNFVFQNKLQESDALNYRSSTWAYIKGINFVFATYIESHCKLTMKRNVKLILVCLNHIFNGGLWIFFLKEKDRQARGDRHTHAQREDIVNLLFFSLHRSFPECLFWDSDIVNKIRSTTMCFKMILM